MKKSGSILAALSRRSRILMGQERRSRFRGKEQVSLKNIINFPDRRKKRQEQLNLLSPTGIFIVPPNFVIAMGTFSL